MLMQHVGSVSEGDRGLRVPVVMLLAGLFCCQTIASLLNWNVADYALIHLLNYPAQRSVLLDHAVGDLSREMFSNLLIMSLVWYAWFSTDNVEVRAGVLVGVVVAFCSGIVSRVLQLALPTHARPLHDSVLHFRPPLAVNVEGLNHWSSFPSDHAAVFFGLAAVVLLVDRKAGWLAMGVAVVINLGRIYLGFHYPSDVMAGGLLGILLVLLAHRLRIHPRVLSVAAVPPRRRAVFYAVAFYASYGIVTLLQDYREVATGLVHHLHSHTL